MSQRKAPSIPAELLDQLLAGTDAAEALDQGGLLDALKKALAERALNAEMDHHLGQEGKAGNSRNGYGHKTVITDTRKVGIEVPRDRDGSFNPQLIAKYQRRFPGVDDKIISMYARGMSTREITGHLRELYGLEVSPDLISTVTDGEHRAVPGARGDAQRWRRWPLGSSARSTRLIRWCSLTRSGLKSGTKGWCAIAQAADDPGDHPKAERSTLRWASAPMATRRFWGFGSSRMRALSSGSG